MILYIAGVVLAVSVIYYRALGLGPISSVILIWGIYFALSSLIGFLALGEKLTPVKGLGLVCAPLVIFLLSR